MVSESHALSELATHVVLPAGIVSTGWPVVREKCAQLGTRFDPWQDGLGRAMLAKRADGTYAAGVGGVCMSLPRQVGKTFTVGNMIFGLCLASDDVKVLWTAHRTRTSGETFKTMQGFAKNPKVAPFVRQVRQVNGQEEISFTTGSRILFGARESGFGRGFDKVDVIVFDEAQILTQKPLDDMIAATNASPNALVLYMGTPPKPTDPAEVFSRIRREALSGGDGETLYVEFSAPEGARVDDEGAWAQANPSFPFRTSPTAMRRLLKNLGEESFRREGLGVWDPESLSVSAVDAGVWERARMGEGVFADRAGGVCFAARFSADGAWLGLGAASRLVDGRVLVDPVRMEAASVGTGWLVDYLLADGRLDEACGVIVEGRSGAAYLIDQLRRAGVPRSMIVAPDTQGAVDAYSMMAAGLGEGRVVHVGVGELDRQVSVASRRKIGSRGGFGWVAPEGDTCCLFDAVTLAAWGVQTIKRKPRKSRGVDGEARGRKKVIVL